MRGLCARVCACACVAHVWESGGRAAYASVAMHSVCLCVCVCVCVCECLCLCVGSTKVYVKAIHVDAANHTYVCVGSTPAGQVYDGKYEIKSNTSMLVVYARTHVFLCVCA